jgi:ABC-2 type transport system permease protein
MAQTWIIAKRELGAYFKSPVAYVVLALFLIISGGLFFFGNFFVAGNASMDGFFGIMPLLLVFICPAIAMRLIAEERGSGSIEMLLTFPVRDSEVVFGKYLAALLVLAVGLLLTLPFAFTVSKLGPLDGGPVLGSYLGTLLLGGTYLAIGLVGSALTKNQVVAVIVGWAICMALWLMGFLANAAGPVVGPVLQYASPAYQFSKIARGVIELRNVVYYLSAIGVCLVISIQVLESRKWR